MFLFEHKFLLEPIFFKLRGQLYSLGSSSFSISLIVTSLLTDFDSGSWLWRFFNFLGHRIVSRSQISPSSQVSISLNIYILSSSLGAGLWCILICRQLLIRSVIFLEYPTGMGSQQPRVTFLLSPGKSLAMKGGLRVASSQSRHPIDHTSTLPSYLELFHIYGLVQ